MYNCASYEEEEREGKGQQNVTGRRVLHSPGGEMFIKVTLYLNARLNCFYVGKGMVMVYLNVSLFTCCVPWFACLPTADIVLLI